MILRILLLFILITFGITAIILALDFIFGLFSHRLWIPFAKLMKFKLDDMKETNEEVKKILKEK